MSETTDSHAPLEWHQDIRQELLNSNDRSTVLVAVGLLESKLQELVKVHLGPSSDGEKLLMFGRPLGNFWALCEVAHRLQIIDKNVLLILSRLREIRNKCAHSSKPVVLSESPYRDWMRDIKAILSFSDAALMSRSELISVMLTLVGSFDSKVRNIENNDQINPEWSYGAYFWIDTTFHSCIYQKAHHPAKSGQTGSEIL